MEDRFIQLCALNDPLTCLRIMQRMFLPTQQDQAEVYDALRRRLNIPFRGWTRLPAELWRAVFPFLGAHRTYQIARVHRAVQGAVNGLNLNRVCIPLHCSQDREYMRPLLQAKPSGFFSCLVLSKYVDSLSHLIPRLHEVREIHIRENDTFASTVIDELIKYCPGLQLVEGCVPPVTSRMFQRLYCTMPHLSLDAADYKRIRRVELLAGDDDVCVPAGVQSVSLKGCTRVSFERPGDVRVLRLLRYWEDVSAYEKDVDEHGWNEEGSEFVDSDRLELTETLRPLMNLSEISLDAHMSSIAPRDLPRVFEMIRNKSSVRTLRLECDCEATIDMKNWPNVSVLQVASSGDIPFKAPTISNRGCIKELIIDVQHGAFPGLTMKGSLSEEPTPGILAFINDVWSDAGGCCWPELRSIRILADGYDRDACRIWMEDMFSQFPRVRCTLGMRRKEMMCPYDDHRALIARMACAGF